MGARPRVLVLRFLACPTTSAGRPYHRSYAGTSLLPHGEGPALSILSTVSLPSGGPSGRGIRVGGSGRIKVGGSGRPGRGRVGRETETLQTLAPKGTEPVR